MVIPKENGFTAEEFQRRLTAVRSKMASREIDALLVFSFTTILAILSALAFHRIGWNPSISSSN